ncbi:hypothetical protein MSG28_015764 [Choristoneura fumiferana]|uniref:Uncharacterized protein n=1 Tax=Choristoneura fumiferana TaxID=7141 RepID=A0ACC0KBR7_CHOFU|nr:hypothetical protein MSG28_015764 [Choristoneura fumiferana]
MVRRALVLGGVLTAGLLALHVALVPLVFRYSKTFRRSLIFANFVQWPLYTNFEDPAASGIEGARNLSIEYQSKIDNCPIKIGIWHILPKTAYERLKGHFNGTDKEQLNRILDEELANSRTPIMLYCHGNSNSRAASHRIQLYKFFQKMEFHTIAFDYRGYGDSTNVHPSEDGVVEDSLMVYEWLQTTIDKGPEKPSLFVWGHSLGTGISSHLLGNLDTLSSRLLERPALPMPNGLILEAPFNNLADEVAHHPLSKLVTWLPYYELAFVSQFVSRAEHCFRSDAHLARAPRLPVAILHARDDVIVPHAVGAKLYESIRQSRAAGGAPVVFHSYEKSESLGHKWICNAKDLPHVIGSARIATTILLANPAVKQQRLHCCVSA